MPGILIGKVLEPLGLYKVNDDYLKSVNEKLKKVEGDLGAISDFCSTVNGLLESVKSKKLEPAVKSVLKFCKIDDDVAELKKIKARVDGGDTLAAVLAGRQAAPILIEIAQSVKKEITTKHEGVIGIAKDVAQVVEEATQKLADIRDAAGDWTFAEKMGTPGAVKNTMAKANKVKDKAREAKTSLETMLETVAGLLG